MKDEFDTMKSTLKCIIRCRDNEIELLLDELNQHRNFNIVPPIFVNDEDEEEDIVQQAAFHGTPVTTPKLP